VGPLYLHWKTYHKGDTTYQARDLGQLILLLNPLLPE
jgi:hypothetical protein